MTTLEQVFKVIGGKNEDDLLIFNDDSRIGDALKEMFKKGVHSAPVKSHLHNHLYMIDIMDLVQSLPKKIKQMFGIWNLNISILR